MLDRGVTHRPVHPLLWILLGAMVLPELLFAAVDLGYVGREAGREAAYVRFGFWDPVFEHARQGYGFPLELLWTPVTHAFLHGGWLHLAMNGAAFLGLGHLISQSVGIRALLWIFLGTAAGGALAYGLLADFRGPMVGASGVVFGFLGVVTAWQERYLRRRGLDRSPIWGRILGLIAINALLDFGMGGMLAWQAHLGGFVAGWIIAQRIRPRPPRAPWTTRQPLSGRA
ncbi:rhomboid family intramembrane serine protease [Paralimibaculum aggregatum]|nr:rhomboid family intramembrane serine protease [Limibaculum sp. NKW23]